jgi:hypothetical protein
MSESLRNLLVIVIALMGASVFVALLGLITLARDIRRLRIPRDADYWTTMRHIPITLVVLLDLLDFGLDIFSAPIIWIALDRMGLPNLRNKATIEALIPMTNVIPTFTLSWFLARMFDMGDPRLPMRRDWPPRPTRDNPRRRRKTTIIDMDDR